MLTYQDVVTIDLAPLTTAAGQWDAMATSFHTLETDYKDAVQSVAEDGVWLGLSANSASGQFAGTRKQYAAAQVEAKAIASLLRDAHTQFVTLVKAVKDLVTQAQADEMIVDGQGKATWDSSKYKTSRNDPDYPEFQRKRYEAATEWTRRIDAAVKAVDDADQGAKLALTQAAGGNKGVIPGLPNQQYGFNGTAVGDIELYEAQKARDIATRINSGEKVSAADYAELNRSFRDNAGNKAFSQTFLAGLGTDGTIKLSGKLNSKEHQDLERGLANTVAGATQVPGKTSEMPPGSKKFNEWLDSPDGKFYKEWTESLDTSGTKNFGSNTQPLHGYQAFVSMMQHADADYDDQFLYQLGDDLIAAEKEHEGIFTLMDAWGGTRGIQGSEAHEHAKGEAQQSFITGREDAYSALRTRK
ncbi:hypothetical protein [Streptomyces sp. NPDC090022]|uniref:hypothetical protein n=1 Tax=Streptomyces sp. NPDC090022 TaxID=3365920 RepID=UPI00381D8217